MSLFKTNILLSAAGATVLALVAMTGAANAAPLGALGANTSASTSGTLEQVHYRGFRHCHWRHGVKRCHGSHARRHYPYGYGRSYGYYDGYYRRPGISLHLDLGGRKHRYR